jgi:hypothetical protein
VNLCGINLGDEGAKHIAEAIKDRAAGSGGAGGRKPDGAPSSDAVGKWVCRLAHTFENNRDAVQCGMCGSAKGGASSLPSSASSSSFASSNVNVSALQIA